MTTTTHNLKHNGAAYNESAELINQDPKVTSGDGRALCTCGAISAVLTSGAARRTWHKEHKLAEANREHAAEQEVLFGQDVAAGTPEDEVAEALAELVEPAPAAAPKKAKAPKAPKAKQVAPTAADEANAATLVLPFTTAVTAGFWRSLGRDATKVLVDTVFPTVTVAPNNNARTLTLQGPSEDVPAAAEAIQEMWVEALAASKEWKKTDATFLGRSTEPLARRQEGYHLTEAFYVSFGTWYANNLQGR